MPAPKSSAVLLEQLAQTLSSKEGKDLARKVKALIVFKIDDELYTLETRPEQEPSLQKVKPAWCLLYCMGPARRRIFQSAGCA